MSTSAEHDAPLVGSTSRSTARPSVVLPHPDSPTSPSVSPGRMSSDTPSTAFTTRCAAEIEMDLQVSD